MGNYVSYISSLTRPVVLSGYLPYLPDFLSILMLLVANFTIQNDAKKAENDRNPGIYGYSSQTRCESYLMSTNMTGFKWFLKIFVFFCFGHRDLARI